MRFCYQSVDRRNEKFVTLFSKTFFFNNAHPPGMSRDVRDSDSVHYFVALFSLKDSRISLVVR